MPVTSSEITPCVVYRGLDGLIHTNDEKTHEEVLLGDGVVTNGYRLRDCTSALMFSSFPPLARACRSALRLQESGRTEAVDSCETAGQEENREQQQRVPQATGQSPSLITIRCGYAIFNCMQITARCAGHDHLDVHGISCESEDDQEIVAREMPCVV